MTQDKIQEALDNLQSIIINYALDDTGAIENIQTVRQALQSQPHTCTASGYVCQKPFQRTQDNLCTADDTLPPVNEATGHDTE